MLAVSDRSERSQQRTSMARSVSAGEGTIQRLLVSNGRSFSEIPTTYQLDLSFTIPRQPFETIGLEIVQYMRRPIDPVRGCTLRSFHLPIVFPEDFESSPTDAEDHQI